MTIYQFAADNAALTFILTLMGCCFASYTIETVIANVRIMVRGYPPEHCSRDCDADIPPNSSRKDAAQ